MARPALRPQPHSAPYRGGAASLRPPLRQSALHTQEAEEPWWMEVSGDNEREGWMVSYLDILTLLLTLLVVILAVTHAEMQKRSVPAPTVEGASVAQAPVAEPQLPETSRSLAAANNQAEDTNTGPTADTPSDVGAGNPSNAQAELPATRPASMLSAAAEIDVDSPTLSVQTIATAPAEIPKADTAPAAPAPVEAQQTTAPEAAEPINTAAVEPVTPENAPAARDDKASLAALNNTGWMQVHVEERGVLIELGEDVLFTPASAALASQTVPALDALAAILQEMPYLVWIEGHTDNTPIATAPFPSNWELSTARATAVTRYLIQHGISPQRLRAVGYGETQPRSSNDTAQGRAENRRVAFRVEMPPPGSP